MFMYKKIYKKLFIVIEKKTNSTQLTWKQQWKTHKHLPYNPLVVAVWLTWLPLWNYLCLVIMHVFTTLLRKVMLKCIPYVHTVYIAKWFWKSTQVWCISFLKHRRSKLKQVLNYLCVTLFWRLGLFVKM